ncbi:MAG: histidine kinase [Paenibacillaceae bacterium]
MNKMMSVRIFAYFLAVIMISLASLGLFTYYQSTDKLNALNQRHMTQIINNITHHTDIYLQNYERSLLSLMTINTVRNSVKNFIDLRPGDNFEYHLINERLRDTDFKNVSIRNPEVASIYLAGDNGYETIHFYSTLGLIDYDANILTKDYTYFSEMFTNVQDEMTIYGHSILQPEEKSVLTVVRKVKGSKNPSQYKGILAIEIRKHELEQLWQGIDLGDGGYFYIIDSVGNIIYHPDYSLLGEAVEQSLADKLIHASTSYFTFEQFGEERVFMVRNSKFSGWKLVISKPIKELTGPVDNIRTTTLIVGTVTLILALFLALRFGRMIVHPIRLLKRGMEETEKGNWVTIPLPVRRDEMYILTKRYNLMVTRLSGLMQQVYEVELSKKETEMERQRAELQALQLQINPHFLYNTLETIACFAAIQDSGEIEDIVKSLAYMLRYSIKTNLEEITVVNELKHVLNYMIILNYRYDKQFEIEVLIPSEFLLKTMVRLTLQPLIENIFQHAFRDGLEDWHSIRIDAEVKDTTFVLTLVDNGSGIPPHKLLELRRQLQQNRLADQESPSQGGIGLMNVHRRIQMVFGDSYGLSIESELGQGTQIFMRLPL